MGVKENKRKEIGVAFSTVNQRKNQNYFLMRTVIFPTVIVNHKIKVNDETEK